MDIPLPVTYDLDVDLEALLKAFHVHLEEQGGKFGRENAYLHEVLGHSLRRNGLRLLWVS